MRSTTEKIDFITKNFGTVKVSREGSNIAVKCPSCKEKKGKFSININTWMCHCWVCGKKSRNLYFILKEFKGRDCAEKFKSFFGIQDSKAGQENNELYEDKSLPEMFTLLANFKGRDPDMRDCIRYCKRRGLSESDLWYFRIGSSALPDFKRRIIIPSFDSEGILNYYVSRAIDRNRYPKYVNSEAKKIEIIFNEINIDWSKEITIVEGPFDLIKCDQNSTCLLGSKLSKKSKLFSKLIENKSSVLLALDPDMKSESHGIAKILTSFGCPVRILVNNTDSDVGEMTKKQFISLSNRSIQWSRESSLRFKINSLKSGSIF